MGLANGYVDSVSPSIYLLSTTDINTSAAVLVPSEETPEAFADMSKFEGTTRHEDKTYQSLLILHISGLLLLPLINRSWHRDPIVCNEISRSNPNPCTTQTDIIGYVTCTGAPVTLHFTVEVTCQIVPEMIGVHCSLHYI